MSLEDLIIERSKKCEVFANPLRSFIALLILAKGEASWSELVSYLKKHVGDDINPNTLSFHIGKLITSGFLEKISIESQPIYKIVKGKVSEIEKIMGNDIIEKTKEVVAP